MSRKLIFGSVSRRRLMGLSPIGVVNGREVFPLNGAEDDEPDGGNDSGGDDDSDDESDDDDDDSDDGQKDEDGKAKKQSRRPSRSDNRADDFRRMRTELRNLKREKTEREKVERDKALKDKPELERLTVERDDAVRQLDDVRPKLTEAQVQLEIIKKSNKYDWADIEDVLNDKALRKAIEIHDDGEISGVEDALKDLAKRKPHFLKTKSDKDSGDGKGNGGKPNGASKSGANPNAGGNGDRTADRARLNTVYPALSRIPQ